MCLNQHLNFCYFCLQGFGWRALVFMTPLFFGVCHLHHLWGLVQLYGLSARVVAMCLLQFLYTTVFGWLVTWILLATGSTLVAVLAHSICNMMGFPPFGQMSRASIVLCVAGVVVFGLSAPKVLLPAEDCRFWWARLQHQSPAPRL
jgi:prenyl protein peptidase